MCRPLQRDSYSFLHCEGGAAGPQGPPPEARASRKRPAPVAHSSNPVQLLRRGNLGLQLDKMLAFGPPAAKRMKCQCCLFGAVDTKVVPCGAWFRILRLNDGLVTTTPSSRSQSRFRPHLPWRLFAEVGQRRRRMHDVQPKHPGVRPCFPGDAHPALLLSASAQPGGLRAQPRANEEKCATQVRPAASRGRKQPAHPLIQCLIAQGEVDFGRGAVRHEAD